MRQVIRLEEGEVTVHAPKAHEGEIACRVETEDGLWVETLGTVFRVSRIYENEQGETSVQRSRLAGFVTAALVVAVLEGEVRTGNAQAAKVNVAAGEKAEVRGSATAQVVGDEPTTILDGQKPSCAGSARRGRP